MYAQVVVLTYQPPDIPSYTYLVPKELEKEIKVGQLVSVPFGQRNPTGLIISLDRVVPRQGLVVKALTSIFPKNPILLPHQIELLSWMASYYHAPMVNCLEAMLPEIPQDDSKLLFARNQARNNLVQRIVLVPSINHIPQTLAQHPQAKNYVIYHRELKPAAKFASWQKILTGSVDYVFGSRSAIFAPCPNLGEIIIYDEHEEGYHDERSPYYNTLTIAEKLQELTAAKLKIIDSSPAISTYFNHSSRINLSGPKVKIVNMLDERKAGNRSPLSQILQDYIKLGYAKGKKILLFLNKKSESGHVYCKNCKYSDSAPKQPDVCPNCQSPDIWFSSINIQSLTTLVLKIVPAANINIIIKFSGLFPARESIDIATASVFYKLLTNKYDLVAHIQTDSLLNIPDYASGEKLFAQITNLKKITRGLLLLQTVNPQDPTIAAASSGNYQKFFTSQLTERKALSYPPFALLVKLSIKGKKEQNLEEKAQTLFEQLSSATELLPVKILPPFKPIFSKKSPRYNIICKIPTADYSLKSREAAVKKIGNYLETIPAAWQTEVEANNLN